MKKYLLSFLILLGLSLSASAINVDSLRNQLATDISAEERFHIYDDLFWSEIYKDPVAAKGIADTCLYIAQQLEEEKFIMTSISNLGNSHLIVNQLDSALHYFEQGLEIAKRRSDEIFISKFNGSKANVFITNGKYEEAEQIMEEVLQFEIARNDSNNIVNMLLNTGNLKNKMGKDKEAITVLLQALDYTNQSSTNQRKGLIHMNIGVVYALLKDTKSAIPHFLEAEQLLLLAEDDFSLTKIYNNLGELHLNEKQYDKSRSYYLKALDLNKMHIRGMAFSNLGLSKIYNKENNNTIALKHAQKALDLDLQINNSSDLPGDYAQLGLILNALKRHDEALEHYAKAEELSINRPLNVSSINIKRNKLNCLLLKNNLDFFHAELSDYFLLQDSFDLLLKQETIKEIETKYETDKKEAANKILKRDQQIKEETILRQRYSLAGTVGGVLLLSILSLLLYRESQKRKKTNQLLSIQKTKIEVLHKELSHRVKNNLSTITSLLRMQRRRLESTEAREAIIESENRIQAMSSIHRRLYQNESNLVNMSDYLNELCRHLKDTNILNNNKITITIEADDIEISPDATMRIGLIVNELITNSLKHAFANEVNPVIKVRLQKSNDSQYQLHYADNGKGFEDPVPNQALKSIGLQLIEDLTEQLKGTMKMESQNGTRYQINFKDTPIV